MASRLSNNLLKNKTPYKNAMLRTRSPNSNVMIGGTYEERQARNEKLMFDQGFTQTERGPGFTIFSRPGDKITEDQTPTKSLPSYRNTAMATTQRYPQTQEAPSQPPETLSQSFERMGIGQIGDLGGRMGELEKASLRLAEAAAQRESRLLAQSGQQAYGLQGLRGEQEYGLQGLRGEQEYGLQGLRGQQETALQRLRGQQEYGLQSLRGQQSIAQQSLAGMQQGRYTPMTASTASYLGLRRPMQSSYMDLKGYQYL